MGGKKVKEGSVAWAKIVVCQIGIHRAVQGIKARSMADSQVARHPGNPSNPSRCNSPSHRYDHPLWRASHDSLRTQHPLCDTHGASDVSAAVLHLRYGCEYVERDMQCFSAMGWSVGRDCGDSGGCVVRCGADSIGLVGFGPISFVRER